MKYRKLDNNGDYSFGSGFSDFVYDKNAIAQAIKTKILLFYGEWWEQIDDGIPMFQSILGAYDTESVEIISDICATAKGYESLYMTQVRVRKGA